MPASNIQAKVKAGLAKAIAATGSNSSDAVYFVSESSTAGTPLSPGTAGSSRILLTNAVFKSYNAKMFNDTILAGDRMLVCDNVTPIKQGDKIQQGDSFYIVINVDIKAPASDVLAYIAQVRLK